VDDVGEEAVAVGGHRDEVARLALAAAAISAGGSPEASTQSASNPSAVSSAQTRSM
jgi:hypothetical protein